MDDATLQFYRRNAEAYAGREITSRHARMAKFLALLPAGAAILELGCGAGADSAEMIARGPDPILAHERRVQARHVGLHDPPGDTRGEKVQRGPAVRDVAAGRGAFRRREREREIAVTEPLAAGALLEVEAVGRPEHPGAVLIQHGSPGREIGGGSLKSLQGRPDQFLAIFQILKTIDSDRIKKGSKFEEIQHA